MPGDLGVEGEFLFNYYDQDGDFSPVTGGLGTEALQVVSPVLISRWSINDRWTLNASFGLDQITSASTDNIDDHVSSASRVDERAPFRRHGVALRHRWHQPRVGAAAHH